MAKNLNYQGPPQLAIAEGATTPNPGLVGVSVWSTTLAKPVYWTGAQWTAGSSSGGGSPGGSSGRVQFNNGGAFEGAQHVGIAEGDLLLTAHEPGALPPAGTAKLFIRNLAGRLLPAYVGPSGLDSALQPLLGRNKISWLNPPGNATTVQVIGMAPPTATGVATAANVATTNIHTAMRRLEYAVTTAAATAVAGLRVAALQYHIGDAATPYGGFNLIMRGGPSRGVAADATRRFWLGMTSITAAPTDVNPSTWAANAIGAGADAADVNWQIMHRAGTGTMTKINTGIPKAAADATEMYELILFTAPVGSTVVGYQFTRLRDGLSFEGVITSNLPSPTQLLTWQKWTSVGGTSSVVGVSAASVYLETDY